MQTRKGEQFGWIGGWGGGFIWVLILSTLWLVKGKNTEGAIGLVLCLFAAVLIVFLAPWRHPLTRYWKLMVPIYAVFVASLVWAIWSAGGYARLGLHPLSVLWMAPIFLPFVTVGRKRWGQT
jgi:hypothetical protein